MANARFSRGIEKVIWLAALDEEFRGRLYEDRKKALENCEIILTPTEFSILADIPDKLFRETIEDVKIPVIARRAFLRGATAAALAFLGGSLALNYGCKDDEDKDVLGLYQPPPAITGIQPGDIIYARSEEVELGGRTCMVHIPAHYNWETFPALVCYDGGDNYSASSVWNYFYTTGNRIFLCIPQWSGEDADVAAEAAAAGSVRSDLLNSIGDINPDKVYIGGFSTGARVALGSALAHDGSWGGVISWAGLLPGGVDPANAPRTNMAVYLGAGDSDSQVQASDVEDLQTQLDGIGFTTNFEIFEGGHDSTIYDPAAAWAWINDFSGP